MAREFPRPALVVRGSIRALPCGKDLRLVGTAVDYLLRFFLEHRNPAAVADQLVAEVGRTYMDVFAASAASIAVADRVLSAATEHRAHIRATGQITHEAVQNALLLGRLDAVARTSRFDESWLSPPHQADIDDVTQIAALFHELDWVTSSEVCLLNPSFPVIPRAIRSADADIVVDDTLIEVKTTIRRQLTQETFNQLVGYTMLERLGGIGPRGIARPPLRHVAVYFARHALLARWRIEDVLDVEALRAFGAWTNDLPGTSAPQQRAGSPIPSSHGVPSQSRSRRR